MINKPFKVVDVEEVYAHRGDFELKVVIDDGFDAELTNSKFVVRDSSGNCAKTSYRIWGNKIKCRFSIDESVSDGVAMATVTVCEKNGQEYSKSVYFWIIK